MHVYLLFTYTRETFDLKDSNNSPNNSAHSNFSWLIRTLELLLFWEQASLNLLLATLTNVVPHSCPQAAYIDFCLS